jgi:hypothetical protein
MKVAGSYNSPLHAADARWRDELRRVQRSIHHVTTALCNSPLENGTYMR